jgi:AP-3 complex subunit delta
VASAAQDSVPIPEGLDLDSFIMPPPKDAITGVAETETAAEGSRPAKKTKGKGKIKARGMNGISTSTVKKSDDDRIMLNPVNIEAETAEEHARRERVGAIQT